MREVWRLWNAGDRVPYPELFAEDIEIHSVLAQTVFTGRDGVRRWTTEIDEQFERWKIDVEEIEEIDGGRVLARGKILLRGRGSGVAMEQPASWLIETQDGRIRCIRNYMGQDAAAEATVEGPDA